ncbi:hypothetical protein L211DRAFT_871506 [Terfezia boudieri ATCC MYA-4762]|uniref:F-box domain-containing protein n=1 Tax=Terfezia boudieri ATCC MYA-4762 TaxID=1051890 RepID=A0A3N4L805_9PEZI|nr:hypothetical protein L211DRAFT_871506 [Terfezia boudieri ATCC MYA-4762]
MQKRMLNSAPETPRRSKRSRKPAADRINFYTDYPTSNRRRVSRKYDSHIFGDGVGLDTGNLNANCPLVKLPQEILSQIAQYLHPRDAIFLSLTNRTLYFGALSSENSFLWYNLGDFKHLIPAHDPRWINNAHWHFMYEVSDEEKSRVAARLCKDEKQHPDNIILKLTFGKRRLPENSPFAKYYPASEGLPPTGVSYRDMLVQTMLGDTLTGCQWCLREPLTQKVFHGWAMRVCHDCFHMNVLPLREIRCLDIDTSRLGIGTGKRIDGNGYRSGVWKATVERLVRASYGPQACLKSVMGEIRAARLKKLEEHEAARKEYRRKIHLLIFEYIKILWQFIGAVDTLSNIDTSHVQALDGIRNLEESSWLPSNENLMGDVRLWLPIASHFPASDLKLEWFLPTADSNFYRKYTSNSEEPTCKNNILGLGRPWMRCTMKRDPKSNWLALAAWTITRSVITRVKRFVPPLKGLPGYRIDEMRLAFGNSFRRKWEERCNTYCPINYSDTFEKELYLWWQGEEAFGPGWSSSVSKEIRMIASGWKEEFERETEAVWVKAGLELYRLGTNGNSST